jgi:hypothetical protein
MTYKKQTKQPKAIELLFEFFSGIDVHNHLRQGILSICYQKFFSSVLGIIVTNAYYIYKLEYIGDPREKLRYEEFLSRLSFQLINNVLIS